jgi:hypothetical protein
MFAKLRSAVSGLYGWRLSHAKSSPERRRMIKEAELAVKQAYLLSPKNPESVWRFTMFLIEQDRAQEAQKFVAAAVKLNPGNSHIGGLVDYVQSWLIGRSAAGDEGALALQRCWSRRRGLLAGGSLAKNLAQLAPGFPSRGASPNEFAQTLVCHHAGPIGPS